MNQSPRTGANKKRQKCNDCGFSHRMCICAFRANVQPSHRVIILQHPSEVKSAKGTVQLLPLVMPSIEIYVGESELDFAPIAAEIKQNTTNTYVVYPSENAQGVESLIRINTDKHQHDTAQNSVKPAAGMTLIFLDGTWRKTLRMWCVNPWLQCLPQLTFNSVPKGEYLIRKAKREDSLSTIETVYYLLRQLDEVDVSPILKIFQQRISMQLRFVPSR